MDSDSLAFALRKATAKYATVRQSLVRPGDKLEDIDYCKTPIALICNTSPHYISSFGHWVAVYITSSTTAEVFNSYGKSDLSSIGIHLPSCIQIKDFSRDFQSDNSKVCGLYALMFLYMRTRHYSSNYFLTLFDNTNKIENDKKVVRFYKNFKVRVNKGGQCCTSKFKNAH